MLVDFLLVTKIIAQGEATANCRLRKSSTDGIFRIRMVIEK